MGRVRSWMGVGLVLALVAAIGLPAAAQEIKLPQGKKFTVGWSNASLGNPWRIAMVEMVKEEAKYPNVKLVSLQPGDYQEAKAITAMENILQANPDLQGVISHSGTMARGALKALRNAGKAGKVLVVAIGSENHVLKEIKRGAMHSTVMEPTRVGVEGFRVVLRPQPEELVVRKHWYDAFNGTPLDGALRARGITSLIVTGIMTDICVFATVVGAFNREYRLTVVSDAVATLWSEIQAATLDIIQRAYGRVVTAEEVTREIEGWRA